MTQHASPAPAHTSPSPAAQLFAAARDIKLSHTVFALPFALFATFLAAATQSRFPSVGELALIVACMFFARSAAMMTNRLLDAKIDSANPRTQKRAIPAGRLSPAFAAAITLACIVAFVFSASGFLFFYDNALPLYLSPLVAFYLAFYSLTKRFTFLCHLYLGSSLALSPLAAGIAITPVSLALPDLWLIAAFIACWVAGFDIIYALQDLDFDLENEVFSMPSALGAPRALIVSRMLHVADIFLLGMLVFFTPLLGPLFLAAAVLTAMLLAIEHALVWKSKTNHIHHAFLTVNGIISILLAAAGISDIVLAT